jgi:hypothetical protein
MSVTDLRIDIVDPQGRSLDLKELIGADDIVWTNRDDGSQVTTYTSAIPISRNKILLMNELGLTTWDNKQFIVPNKSEDSLGLWGNLTDLMGSCINSNATGPWKFMIFLILMAIVVYYVSR